MWVGETNHVMFFFQIWWGEEKYFLNDEFKFEGVDM